MSLCSWQFWTPLKPGLSEDSVTQKPVVEAYRWESATKIRLSTVRWKVVLREKRDDWRWRCEVQPVMVILQPKQKGPWLSDSRSYNRVVLALCNSRQLCTVWAVVNSTVPGYRRGEERRNNSLPTPLLSLPLFCPLSSPKDKTQAQPQTVQGTHNSSNHSFSLKIIKIITATQNMESFEYVPTCWMLYII